MPRLSEASRQRRREVIAAAAQRCFLRDGFASTTMADIIGEAGSSAGSVYSHFAGKADLVRFTASATLGELVAAVETDLPSRRTPARVLAHLLGPASDRPRAQVLLQIWAEVPRDPELAAIALGNLHRVRDQVRAALLPWCQHPAHRGAQPAAAAAEAVADGVLTAVQGFLVRVAVDPDVDAELLAGRLVAAFERP